MFLKPLTKFFITGLLFALLQTHKITGAQMLSSFIVRGMATPVKTLEIVKMEWAPTSSFSSNVQFTFEVIMFGK